MDFKTRTVKFLWATQTENYGTLLYFYKTYGDLSSYLMPFFVPIFYKLDSHLCKLK